MYFAPPPNIWFDYQSNISKIPFWLWKSLVEDTPTSHILPACTLVKWMTWSICLFSLYAFSLPNFLSYSCLLASHAFPVVHSLPSHFSCLSLSSLTLFFSFSFSPFPTHSFPHLSVCVSPFVFYSIFHFQNLPDLRIQDSFGYHFEQKVWYEFWHVLMCALPVAYTHMPLHMCT